MGLMLNPTWTPFLSTECPSLSPFVSTTVPTFQYWHHHIQYIIYPFIHIGIYSCVVCAIGHYSWWRSTDRNILYSCCSYATTSSSISLKVLYGVLTGALCGFRWKRFGLPSSIYIPSMESTNSSGLKKCVFSAAGPLTLPTFFNNLGINAWWLLLTRDISTRFALLAKPAGQIAPICSMRGPKVQSEDHLFSYMFLQLAACSY